MLHFKETWRYKGVLVTQVEFQASLEARWSLNENLRNGEEDGDMKIFVA